MSLSGRGAYMASGMAGPPRSVCLVVASSRRTSTSGMCARSTLRESGNVEIERGKFV